MAGDKLFKRPSLSKSRQVYIALRERIARGVYDQNGGLPGEQTLAAELGVSRVTLRRALASLKEDGVIDRRRGAGTFLNDSGKPAPITVDLADAMSQLAAMGASTEVRLLDFVYEEAPGEVADALGLSRGALVQRSVRRRLLNGQAFSYLVAYVPEIIGRTFSPEDLSSRPLLGLLERAGCRVDHATQDLGAELAGPDAAQALGIDMGAPLISLTRTIFDADGAGLQHLRALYRPDLYRFRMELVRAGERSQRHWEPMPNALDPHAETML